MAWTMATTRKKRVRHEKAKGVQWQKRANYLPETVFKTTRTFGCVYFGTITTAVQ